MTAPVTIRQKYDGLTAYLLGGVFNLTQDEIQTALTACTQLLAALPLVSITFDLEPDLRSFTNQIKIIQKQLQQILVPTFTAQVIAPPGSNLYEIASEQLNDSLRWKDIAALNNLSDPFIYVFTTLQMPV